MKRGQIKTPPGEAGGAIISSHSQEISNNASSNDQEAVETKKFTRDIFVWLNQVAADPELHVQSSRLCIIFTRYINRKTGDAWPSIRRLSDDMNCSENTVRSIIRSIVDRGHLAVSAGGGSRSNTYRIVIDPCKNLKGSPLQISEGVNLDTPSTYCRAPLQDPEVDPFNMLKRNHMNKNHKINHLKVPAPVETVRRATQLALITPDKSTGIVSRTSIDREKLFRQFWAVYPCRDNEHGSRGEYFRQIDQGECPEKILSGAIDYEKYIRSENKFQFVKEAKNWLREKRWRDDWKSKIQSKSSGLGIGSGVMKLANHLANGGEI